MTTTTLAPFAPSARTVTYQDVTPAPSAMPMGMDASAFKARRGGTIMDAHHEWRSRPADEACPTIADFVQKARAQRMASKTAKTLWGDLRVAPTTDGDLRLVGKTGAEARLTNWSAGQLATAAGAPLGYLTTLPAELAAECLTYGLQNTDKTADASLLFNLDAHALPTLRAITTTRYSRVWDEAIATRIEALAEGSSWGPAEAFKTASGRAQHAWGDAAPLPLGWVGDRSSFALLVDYDGAVQTSRGTFARFLMLSNSEVGGGSLKVTFGLIDFVCCNMIMWGCSEVHEAKFRHVGAIQDRVAGVFAPLAASRLGAGEREDISRGILAASRTLLGDDKVQTLAVAKAATGLPAAIVAEAYQRADGTPRYGDPRSVWGMLSGLTEASQHAAGGHADKRADMDVLAAKLMRLAK